MRAELLIAASEDGLELGEVLKRRGYSRRLTVKLKHTEGGITRAGQLLRTVDTVRAGETVLLACEEKTQLEPSRELCVPVIYEDSEVIVFDKPPGMPVHPSMKHRTDTLGNYFAHRFPGLTFRPVNRLDRDTSGCVLIAKSQYAAAALQGSFGKEYLALCCGRPEGSVIDAPIAREHESLIKRCVREDGREALTRFEIIGGNGKYTLCRVFPETGRTHQIRVHFAYIGCPLAGDDLYGGSREDIARQALHCASLTFTSPADSRSHTVSSALPQDIADALRPGQAHS